MTDYIVDANKKVLPSAAADFRAALERLLHDLTEGKVLDGAIADALTALATPPPEPPTVMEALAARPLLEQVARLGDCIGANTVGKIMAISSRAAAWMEANPPGQPVAIEPRGCPTPGACSCVEPATPPPEPPPDEQIAAAIQKGADQEFYATLEALAEYCGCGVELTDSDAREVLYELRRPHIALDGWGNEKHKSGLEKWGR